MAKQEQTAVVAEAIDRIASAILPSVCCGSDGPGGGYVSSLTEAMMDVSASLCKIADSIGDLAEAVRERA